MTTGIFPMTTEIHEINLAKQRAKMVKMVKMEVFQMLKVL